MNTERFSTYDEAPALQPVSWLSKSFVPKPLNIPVDLDDDFPIRRRKRRTPEEIAAEQKIYLPENKGLTNNFRRFSFVGYSRYKGDDSIWFSDSPESHSRRLEKNGHFDVDWIALPEPMNKLDAVRWLQNNPDPLFYDALLKEKEEKLVAALARSKDKE